MTDNQYELTQHCIDTEEFATIKISDRHLLFHKNVVNKQLDLGKIFFNHIVFILLFFFVRISIKFYSKNFQCKFIIN